MNIAQGSLSWAACARTIALKLQNVWIGKLLFIVFIAPVRRALSFLPRRTACACPPLAPITDPQKDLECRKWGFKRWGFKQIWGYLRKKAFSSVFWISQELFAPPEKGRKRQKKAEKGRKGRSRPISRKGSQTPLKPPFVTPPFAATQKALLRFFGAWQITRNSTERQKYHQTSAPVLVIISRNSLAFSRKLLPVLVFNRCCAPTRQHQ